MKVSTNNQQADGPTCPVPTKSGNPCQGKPHDSGYCFAHDPATKEEREAARVKGGQKSSRAARLEKLLPSRLRPTFDRLEAAMKEVHEGHLDPRQATAMASLAGAMVKVIRAGEQEASTDLPPQFFVKDLGKWYEDIRAIRQMKPPMSYEEEYEKDPRMAEYIREYGRDIKYPTEIL